MEGTSTQTLSRDTIRKILSAHTGAFRRVAARRDPPWAMGHVSLVISGRTPSEPVWAAAAFVSAELVAEDSRNLEGSK